MDGASQPLARLRSLPQLPGYSGQDRRKRVLAVAAVVGAALVAVVLGALAAYSPVIALGAAMAIAYVVLVVRDFQVALALWVPLIFFEGLAGMQDLPEATGALLVLGWLGTLVRSWTSSGELGERIPGPVVVSLAALVLWATASLMWAEVPDAALSVLIRLYLVVLFFVMLVNSVGSRRVLIWILGAFVLGAAISVVYGVATGLNDTGDAVADTATVAKGGRLQGGVGDPNFLAAALISGAAMAGAIAMGKRARPGLRALLLLAGVILPIGVLSTGSRGRILAAVCAILLTLFILRGYRRRVLTLLVLGIVAVSVYAVVSPVAPLDRFTEIEGGSGREDLWTVGWRMTVDHSEVGVGLGNFTERAHEYTREPGALTRVNYITEIGQEVHNLYLEMTTELGVIGLVLLLAFVVACLRCTWQAERRFRRLGDRRMVTFARLLIIAQVSMLAADFFLSAFVDKRLWVILALGPILANIATREAASPPSPAVR
jgi:hypothetical protein